MVNFTILFFRYIWYILRCLWPNMVSLYKNLPMKFIIRIVVAMLLLLYIGPEKVFAQQSPSDQANDAGLRHFNLGDYASAITTWENLLRNDSNYAKREEVWYSIAKAAILQKSQPGNEKAIEYLDKIITLKNVSGQFYGASLFLIGETFYNYANQLSETGNLVQARVYALEAKKHFDLLLTEIPDSPNRPQALFAQTQIAVLYLKSAVETKKYAELALSSVPNHSPANQEIINDCMFYYAWAIGQLGEIAEARRIFGTLIQAKDPKRGPKSLYELAHTYFRNDEYQKALNELDSYRSYFPNDTTESLNIQRLQASCHYHLEDFDKARVLMESVITQQESQNHGIPAVEDQIFLTLCYLKVQKFDLANQYISFLEGKYGNTPFADGLQFLRAIYFAELGQFQSAVELLSPILDARPTSLNGQITFNKLPRNAETADAKKSRLSEEYYIRAASQLAICYAKLGNTTVARQVYNAMLQVSQQMYSRYSTIREKTLSQIIEIEKSLQAGTFTPPTAMTPSTVTTLSNPGNPVSVPSSSVVTGMPGSVIQYGGSNSLATRVWATPADQNAEIDRLQTRANNAREQKEYADGVLNDLAQLMKNRNLTDYNNARVAILLGELKYSAKGDRDIAIQMAELAYENIVNDHTENNRNTETFVRAAKGLGRYAAVSGDYTAAAKYFGEALVTKVGNQVEHRAELRYRYGAALMNFPDKRIEAIGCFTAIDDDDKTSKFWSHAALQLALDDYKNGDYPMCEKTIDELIEVMPDKAILDRVLFLKGELALKNKQWDIAAASFDAVCRYVPDSSLAQSAAIKRRDAHNQLR